MGTRSITEVYEMDSLGSEIVCRFFRHYDGYPESHGIDLAQWLEGKRLVNGMDANFKKDVDFNRAGTMSIPLMSHIQGISGAEVVPTDGDSSDYGQDYTYKITYNEAEGFLIEFNAYNEDLDEHELLTLTPKSLIEKYGSK